VPGLRTPFPLGERLPSVYQEDDLTRRFTAGLDEVLAPVQSTLDNLWAYVDPGLCPPDHLPWLAGWVGVELADDVPETVRRELVATAADWQRARGTAAGLRELAERLTGGQVEVSDGRAVTWSTVPAEPRPAPTAAPVVRVTVHGAVRPVDVEGLTSLLREVAPAHVVVQVHVVGRPPAEAGPAEDTDTGRADDAVLSNSDDGGTT
jgi:phage tail-like protein